MAALTRNVVEVRHEAAVLRSDAATLRVVAEHVLSESRRRRAACVLACERSHPLGALRFQSAWSDLHWRSPARDLDRVLVAVGGSDS